LLVVRGFLLEDRRDRPDQCFGECADNACSGHVHVLGRELAARDAFAQDIGEHLTEAAAAADALGIDFRVYRFGDKGIG